MFEKHSAFDGEVKVFTLILPKNRPQYLNKLETMFAKRSAHDHGMDTDESIYIVYEDMKRNLFGSCRVNPLKTSVLTQAGLVERNNCDRLGLLEVSCVSFDEEKVLLGDPNRVFLTRWFYEGLLDVLKTFQINNNLKGFVSLNDPHSHEQCEDFGQWSFDAAFAFPLPNSQDELYGGFLLCESALAQSSEADGRVA